MAIATLNNLDVISARVTMPLSGAWHADVIVDSPSPATGAAVLTFDGGLSLTGRTVRTGSYLETTYLRMAAGSDGLRKTAKPKFYSTGTVGLVLRDLLATAGETLAASSSGAALSTRLRAWATISQPVGNALAVLLARGGPAGTTWRHLPDGTLWVGTETWPDSGLVDDEQSVPMGALPHEDWVHLGVVVPSLRPGTLLSGRRVSSVEHELRDGYVRTSAMLQAG